MQLHSMMMHDGYVEAATVGSLYGFHRAIQRFNRRHTLGPPAASRLAPELVSRSHDYILPVCSSFKVTEYGVAIGSTCPDFHMVYHVDGKVTRLQDPNNHVWIYFRTEKADRLYLDVGSLPYGMGLMLNIVGYLPPGTPEADFLRFAPAGKLGAPAYVLDSEQMALLESVSAGAKKQVRSKLMAERQRIPLSGLPPDEEPQAALQRLLQQLREANVDEPQPAPDPAAQPPAATATSPPSSGSTSFLGAVAAAAVVTAAIMKGPTSASAASSADAPLAPPAGPSARGGRGSTGGGGTAAATAARPPTSTSASPSPSPAVAAATAGPSSTGSGSVCAPRGAGAGGGGARPVVPFRDGPLDKHVTRAMAHFEVAFNNTYAVLEQGYYKNYPLNINHARSLPSWATEPPHRGPPF